MQDREQHLEKVVEELTARVNHLEQLLAEIGSAISGISTGKDPVSNKDPVSKDPVSKDPVSKDPRKDHEPIGPILNKEELTDRYYYITAAGKYVYGINMEYKLVDLSQVPPGGKPRLMNTLDIIFYVIVVSESGQLIGASNQGRVYRYKGEMADTWEYLGGIQDVYITELFIRPDNSIYGITHYDKAYSALSFKGENRWEKIEENQLKQVSVWTPEHGGWGTNWKGEIFHQQEGGKWERIPGTLEWVAAGHGGVWGVSPQGVLYHYLGEGNWEKVEANPEPLKMVAVANNVLYGIIAPNDNRTWKIKLK
jgi:hypothetical protein